MLPRGAHDHDPDRNDAPAPGPRREAAPLPLLEALTELSGLSLADHDVAATQALAATLALRVLPSASAAAVVEDPRLLRAAHSTHPQAQALILRAAGAGTSPLHEALCGGALHLPDLRREVRWPAFVRPALLLGVRSLLALSLTSAPASALVLLADRPLAFDGHDGLAGTLAGYLGAALHNAAAYARQEQVAAQLGEAMLSRDVIEQAKGVIVSTHRCTPDEAFALLVSLSQHSNRKLRDVAQALVVATGSGRAGPPV